MMRIGLWGGSFNPPTLAHKAMADEAVKLLQLDELWWIIAPHNPLKDIRTLAPFEDRLAMVRLVLRSEPHMKASDLEHQLKSSITLNTLPHVRKDHENDHLFLLMGMDNWETLHLWGDDHHRLFDYASIAVFQRPGYDGFENAPSTHAFTEKRVFSVEDLQRNGTWMLLDNKQMDIAATNIRKAIAKGETPKDLDPLILQYISEKGLYS